MEDVFSSSLLPTSATPPANSGLPVKECLDIPAQLGPDDGRVAQSSNMIPKPPG